MDIELKDLTEREILINHSTVLEKLCGGIETVKSENTTDHGKIFEKIEDMADNKISNRLFFRTMGMIFIIIIGLTGYVGNLSNRTIKNEVCIVNIEDHIGIKKDINKKDLTKE